MKKAICIGVLVIALISGCIQEGLPGFGNGVVEKGETRETSCEDGTKFDECSENIPKYCFKDGVLRDQPLKCGCPEGYYVYFGGAIVECRECTSSAESVCDDHFDNDCDGLIDMSDSDCQELKWSKTYKIAVVEFEPTDITYEEGYLSMVNNKEIRKSVSPRQILTGEGELINLSYYSFYYIEDFLTQEAEKYGRTISISVDVLGPFTLTETPPQRTAKDACENVLGPFFTDSSKKNGINLENYDIVNFVYFTEGVRAFWPCAGTHSYTAIGSVERALLGYDSHDIETIIHETMHKFGAGDKYDGWRCVYPEGYAEPNKIPLYPQSKACLMCGKVPSGETSSGEPADLSTYVVCEKTAREIGWK